MTNKLSLEDRVRQLEDELARLKRENEDTLSNLDMSNLGSGLVNRLNTMQSKTNALSGAISVNGTMVTIRAHKIVFENIKTGTIHNEAGKLGYCEMDSSGTTRWHLPNVTSNGDYD